MLVRMHTYMHVCTHTRTRTHTHTQTRTHISQVKKAGMIYIPSKKFQFWKYSHSSKKTASAQYTCIFTILLHLKLSCSLKYNKLCNRIEHSRQYDYVVQNTNNIIA